MTGNLYLVGPMGAGKTTVGKRLAGLLGRDFADTDQLLERRTGVTVSHIFEIEGEQGFRRRESRLLAEISRQPNQIVATGGGIVADPANRLCMRESGMTIYLRVPFDILWRRLCDSRTRPLLQTDDPEAALRDLIAVREPLYRENAALVVEVDTDSAAKTAAGIADWLRNQ